MDRACVVHHCAAGDRPLEWPRFGGGCTDLVVPCSSFVRSLGMSTDAELDRQLPVDLPYGPRDQQAGVRCLTLESGARGHAVPGLLHAGRLCPCSSGSCTPVCLLASCECLTHFESTFSPVGAFPLRKRLMLSLGPVDVSVFVSHRMVVVSSNPSPRLPIRGGHVSDGRRANARRSTAILRRRSTASPQRLPSISHAQDESTGEEGVEQRRRDASVSDGSVPLVAPDGIVADASVARSHSVDVVSREAERRARRRQVCMMSSSASDAVRRHARASAPHPHVCLFVATSPWPSPSACPTSCMSVALRS